MLTQLSTVKSRLSLLDTDTQYCNGARYFVDPVGV